MSSVDVTDHALVRWLSRVHGMPMEYFREQLGEVVRHAVEAGACGLVKDGMTYRIVGNKLITVAPRHTARQE